MKRKPYARVRRHAAEEPAAPSAKAVVAMAPTGFTGEAALAGSSYYDAFYRRPYNPAKLFQKDFKYGIYDDAREDDQVKAVLTMKKLVMLGSGWRVDSDPGEEEVRMAVEHALREYLLGGIDDKLFQVMSALDYGFSISEIIAEAVPDGPYAGRWFLRDLKGRPPHGMVLHTDTHGNLTKIMQDQLLLPPEKFFMHAHQPDFGNVYGSSDINIGVYRAWWSKDKIVSFWNMYLESRAFPGLWGKFGKGFNKTDQEKLLEVLESFRARTAVVTPETVAIEVLKTESATTQAGYESAIEKYNLSIARGILVPDLIGLSGAQTGGGSYALGKEQFKMFYLSLARERKIIEQKVNREIVALLIAWNFGDPGKSSVRFRFDPMTADDAVAQADAWAKAVQAKLWEPNDEEIEHFRRVMGFPEGPVKRPKPVPIIMPGAGGAFGGKGKPPADGQEKPEPDDEDAKAEAKAQEKAKAKSKEMAEAFTPGRALTTYERRVDFAEMERRFVMAAVPLSERMAKVIRAAANEVAERVVDRRILEGRKIAAAAADLWPGSLRRDLRVALRASMRAQAEDGYEMASGEVKASRQFAVIDGVGGLSWGELGDVLDDRAQLSADQALSDLSGVTTTILQDAIRQGKPVKQAMRELDAALRGWDVEYGAARLETIVRTNLSTAFNAGREASFDDNADQISAFQLSAVLDGRTSEVCQELDGLVVEANDERFTPPFHFSCRTVKVPILTGEQYTLSELPALQPAGGTFLRLAQEGKTANEV